MVFRAVFQQAPGRVAAHELGDRRPDPRAAAFAKLAVCFGVVKDQVAPCLRTGRGELGLEMLAFVVGVNEKKVRRLELGAASIFLAEREVTCCRRASSSSWSTSGRRYRS